MPRVSIGLPVYNGGTQIGEAIASLLAQEFTDFELIISDNGSTDNTEAICREFAARDARIRYVRQPENLGVKRNFQFVLHAAQADYFLWAAHDDRWAPNYLSELVPMLDAHPLAVLATPQTQMVITRKGRTRRQLHPPAGGATRLATYRQLLRERSAVWIYGLYRTASLRNYFPEYVTRDYPVWGGDLLWLASVALREPIVGNSRATFHKQEGESRFRPHTAADEMRVWSALLCWFTRVAWSCSPTRGTAAVALWTAWRFCFRGYLSRGNPIGTAVRCVKVSVLALWFAAKTWFGHLRKATS